ncbi:MAG: UDP-N-acetylglucosamine 1-carboxyvinyltransferase [Candidatus Magasanikbacteria bacterium]|nr:UDP-N-acetylglucosamine 1-carboxyvinyltransferase [Candidatus Magasanikbacteria bacterium]
MASYIIRGGKKLQGSISVNTAKNSAVALLCASLMLKGRTVLHEVPRVEEVNRMLELLSSIGVSFEWQSHNTLILDTSKDLNFKSMNVQACARMRSSLLFLGALAARERTYHLYQSGGCKLGDRSIEAHVLGLKKMGIDIEARGEYLKVTNRKLRGAKVVMYEAGVTPTENLIMAAVLAPGETLISFASADYMVQDLCYFLVSAGAKIKGIGSSTLRITGVERLKPVRRYHIMPDPLEAMAFIAMATVTKSELTVANCPVGFLELELEKLSVMGLLYTLTKERISKNGKFAIADIHIFPSELSALPDKIHGMPFPGINLDNLPFFIPICTQAKGRSLIHDWAYENRAVYALEFNKMGAHIQALDIHRILIQGPVKLKAADIHGPDAIRPSMMLLVGLLAAKGQSRLDNIYQIERGYEHIPERLKSIGAHITRLED